jgi:hypothetical protein
MRMLVTGFAAMLPSRGGAMQTRRSGRRRGSMVRCCAFLASVGCASEPASSLSATDADAGSGEDSTASVGCEIAETPAAQDRPIRLRNSSDHSIWITGVHSIFPFGIEGPGGTVTLQIYGVCESCSNFVDQGCEFWCEDHGDEIAIRVQPGGIFEKIWSGQLRETITLACEECDAQCDSASIAPPGDYMASANVMSTCSPDPRASPGLLPGCDCTPDENGACELFLPAATVVDGVEVEAAFVWPGVEPVELVLQ